jgi:hypothetical protein
MTKGHKVQIIAFLVAVVVIVGPLLFLRACATDEIEFPRKKQSLPAGLARTVEIYHVGHFEHISADMTIRDEKGTLVQRFSFDGTTSDPNVMVYDAVVSSNQNMVAVVRRSEPRIIRALYDFPNGDMWWHMKPYEHGKAMLARFQDSFPDTIYALDGTDEEGMILRGEM